MATIYRFVVQTQASGGNGGRRSGVNKKGTNKGHWVSALGFGGSKGGVEHNRKLRAINPMINRITGGYWEKGMRFGRAIGGLVQKNTETGQKRLNPISVAIIIQMVLMVATKFYEYQLQLADTYNTNNFKKMENGVSQIHGQYKVAHNVLTGRNKYNEND